MRWKKSAIPILALAAALAAPLVVGEGPAAGATPETRSNAGGSATPEIDLRLADGAGAWILTNKASGDTVTLSTDSPVFDFGEFQLGGRPAGTTRWRRESSEGGRIRWLGDWAVAGEHAAEIRAVLDLDTRSNRLRKTAEIRLLKGSPALLRSVVLDEVLATGQSPIVTGGGQSHPILGRSFFFGVEFPMATSIVEEDRIVLSHAPGRTVHRGETFRSRTAVYGTAPLGQVREAFLGYIDELRPAPHRLHFNYNTWWTAPSPYTETDILNIIADLKDNLVVPHGVSPDTFCIDMGWSKGTSIWKIHPKLFPRGFKGIVEFAGEIHTALGLWVSPSGVYGQALDLGWAKDNGYEADDKACLAGPRYQAALKESLLDIVTKYGIAQIELDGYWDFCDSPDHGHPPGPLSAEPVADGMIDILVALRRAAPNLWIEPSVFGFDPSPWWLQYCNSTLGSYGDDAPFGRVPCPTYRESYTTARDYFNLKGARDMLAPIAAQEVLGIIHQSDEPLQNDAVVAVLRGHQFLSLYVNPDRMSPRRWEFLAALMKWARRHEDILANTRPILPDSWRRAGGGPTIWEVAPAPREPYGYAHWKGERGLVCLRNPWIEPATVTLSPADDLGLPPAASGLTAVSVYPERRKLADGFGATQPLVVPLAPYETLLIEIGPSDGTAPEAQPPDPLPVVRVSAKLSRVQSTSTYARYGPTFPRLWTGKGARLQIRLSGEIEIPAIEDRGHELLLLVEGDEPVLEPACDMKVNGGKAEPAEISSETGWHASESPKAPEHWLWLAFPLAAGKNRLEGTITLSDASHTIAGWVVRKQAVEWRPSEKTDGEVLPPPEERTLASVPVFESQQLMEMLPVKRGGIPEEPRDPLFLDTLEPDSVTQGWGELQRNESVWEKPISIAGHRFIRGLGTHAPSKIIYKLKGKYRRFRAWAGADQATSPTITMEVRVDGTPAWRSGVLTRNSRPQRVDVDVTGARTLQLLVGDARDGMSNDHADWADAYLLP